MAADAISLYLDLSTPQGALVKGLLDKTPATFGPFYQAQLLKLRVYPVVATGAALGTTASPLFAKLPLSNLELQAVVGPAAGSEAIKAAQYTWSKQSVPDADGESGYFYADLDLNTNDLNTLVGSNATITTQFEFGLSRSGSTFRPVYNTDIVIKAVVKDPGSAASIPTPAASYLTADQCYALFVMWDNRLRSANNGRGVITLSPDGSHTRESCGVDDNGAPTDNLT